MLFGINGNTKPRKLVKRLNHTSLFMKYYIYSIKLEEESLSLEEFVHKIDLKVKIEKLVSQDS